jgi:hypothetical protein
MLAGDSLVPMLSVGLEGALPDRPRIADLVPAALAHFDVGVPPSMRRPVGANA